MAALSQIRCHQLLAADDIAQFAATTNEVVMASALTYFVEHSATIAPGGYPELPLVSSIIQRLHANWPSLPGLVDIRPRDAKGIPAEAATAFRVPILNISA